MNKMMSEEVGDSYKWCLFEEKEHTNVLLPPDYCTRMLLHAFLGRLLRDVGSHVTYQTT